ncbi:NAD(P)/FAD-dependent oxidoreductase [Brevundimonas subvibrioides]|uniref:FAD-dependent pyridine nucleotide-disulfide oxidoreductase n=1 Tax=Brevundimonas subvibrioides (strain ATCC 15264 / DSM 4735 / LMG 14903 / NBRC 16000 / CB 81) TaxID=633149 RepID=D9QGQ4_BRESC|nr:FAD-dependent oxidoreductase [Brevundimonas subvibrioides]ADL00870.1 FAD-dependent pyridine nucleotide-disulfide oxidoreductase [Brevundimonas subvibrioides ATCC 15264]
MKVVIVGAGHAGGSAAALLKASAFEGEIVLLGDEPALPYQRPPLSKAWLKGEADLESLLLRPESYYAEQGITLRTGVVVSAVSPAARTVTLSDGSVETYDTLILATGSTGRRLPIPGADRSELIELRTLADAERLKGQLGPGRRLVIVGGGYVGLEAAASARALGAEVVLLERLDRVLKRVASEPLSAFFTARHRAEGVDIRLDVEVAAFEDGGVRLADGTLVEADVILVGVGALANDGLARAAGLACDPAGSGGIVVDETARTSDPSIYAIGDVTVRPVPVHGLTLRLESVPNALEQARQAAHAIVGRAQVAPEVPWFWSDQYDLKLQIAGLPQAADRTVVRGDPATGRFAVFHLCEDRIVCVEAVNAPPEFMAGKQMIGRRTPVDVAKLTDLAVSMKAVALEPAA